uniref:Uncharacterized protein n=1 Tax=Cucumis melo TaxID=3656 RepID=A0A9I9CU18_CUCME
MDGATSSKRMRDRDDGGWVHGDATTAVGGLRTNIGWSKHSPLTLDLNVATQRRWLTERGATRGVVASANDEQ